VVERRLAALVMRHVALAGVIVSLCLFILSAFWYGADRPSGIAFVRYDWSRQYISTLFAATVGGSVNPGRPYAVAAMTVYCVSIALVFSAISRRIQQRGLAKTIEICGIGAMLYALLAVTTVLHDMLVTVSLTFALVALIALLLALVRWHRPALVIAGALVVSLLLGCAALYYRNALGTPLAVGQKFAFVCASIWLLSIQYARP
jgi:hypothetical protein